MRITTAAILLFIYAIGGDRLHWLHVEYLWRALSVQVHQLLATFGSVLLKTWPKDGILAPKALARGTLHEASDDGLHRQVRGQQQECYICRPGYEPFIDGELDKQFPLEQLPICGQEPPLRKVCPTLYTKGCLTQKRGLRILSKMCSGVEVSECQEANDINYCYCKGNLCNAEVVPTTTHTPETDDEDLSSEGSGEGVTQPTSTTTKAVEKHAPTRAASSNILPSLILTIPSIFYIVL